jgi:acetyltransferase-like isoleucine patch superfamily enzyme
VNGIDLDPLNIYEFERPEEWKESWLFTPYDLSIDLGSQVTVEVGRFSHGVIPSISAFASRNGPTYLKIGAFCETSARTCIQVGGEHQNGELWNHSFNSVYNDHFKGFMPLADTQLSSPISKPVVIGDNVLVSRSAIVANAANVGNGCVIGAGAVVVGKCEPLGVYGGVPARRIRDRFDRHLSELYQEIHLANIAAHCVVTLPSKLSALKQGLMTLREFKSSVQFLPNRAKIHLKGKLSETMPIIQGITGFSVGDVMVSEGPELEFLKRYFSQGSNGRTSVKWSPDIFYKLGLY